ncbi:MAG: Lon protease 2 [Phycisphaerae bacterium]|nr:Lon protease 2 [Phycisphaerae bacterium]
MDHAAEKVTAADADETPSAAPPETALAEVVDDDEDAVRLPDVLPVLPVRNVVVFPGTVMPLSVSRDKSKRLIDDVFAGDKLLVACAQRREDTEDPDIDDIYRVGTACRALKLLRMPDGSHTILVHGLLRAGIIEFAAREPYWTARIQPRDDRAAGSIELEAMIYSARDLAAQVIELSPNVPDEAATILNSIDKPGALADYLSANLSLGLVQKQELLETFDVVDRFRKVNATLNNQLEILQLSQKIQSDVKTQVDKTQREYFLHEQMKAIQKELGEGDSSAAELAELSARIDAAQMPEPVLAEARRELGRLERIPAASPERSVVRDYLDWLCDMPWHAETSDNLDLNRAQEVLAADHYGLEKIKKRILEYLAVRKLKPDGKSPILCFAGPPGVGKTSLGQSIARALGRKFIRISLGGVRDEADIRGHRRTYIGAIPGRLVQEIRKVGVRNPVIMLDEMDKIGADFRGDPASALLEVLDPSQNHTFTDHYLGVPFDLTRVMFIGTANYMEPVSPALRDRMEVIDLPGYTTSEKLEIAKRYLVPRQKEENGLADVELKFPDDALRAIIESYTRDAGVRNLDRTIASICRAVAANVARGDAHQTVITVESLSEFLGPPRYEPELALRTSTPGVATGLAYTPVGGEIIFVESTAMSGNGGFQLTGQIGDVMRESAQAALSLVRSRGKEFGITHFSHDKTDIHIHVPAGGIPKDGPSAGVAMLTSIVSLLTERVADPLVAMTGEITLRGLVLPIGGVKEKVLAAHRAGIRTVILPARNQADLVDVPPEVQKELRFVFAERVEQVLKVAIPPGRQPAAKVEARRAVSGRGRHGSAAAAG